MPDFPTNFGTLDWVIVGLYLSGSLMIGVIANRYVHRIQDFIVAGRSLRGFLSFATMTGTELGLVTIMYAAQEGFQRGLSSLHIGIIQGVCMLGIGLSGAIVLPLRKLGVMTIPEYYLKRFGKPVQVVGGIILVAAGVLNMGLFLQAGAVFVTCITGLPADGIWLNVVMTGMLALVLIYTVLGGMVSVVITDYIQFVVLSVAVGLITFFAVRTVGWNEIFSIAEAEKGIEGINPFANDEYGVTYLIYMFLVGFGGGAVWQTAVMRACAVKSPEVVRPLYMATSISFWVRHSFPAFWGVCAFAFFATQPDLISQFAFPDTDGTISTQAGMPLFLAQILPTGLIGLVAAGMLAAFMSTHDSYLLCWSSVFTQDIVAPMVPNMSDRARILTSRIAILVIGIFLLVWGLWFEAPETLWNYMAGTGTIYFAGAFPVLLGGIYWKRSSKTGAMLALLLGLVGVTTVLPWKDWTEGTSLADSPLTSTPFWGLVTYAAAGAGFVIGSLLWPDKETAES